MQHLTEAEIRVMEVLWTHGALPAGEIAKQLKDAVGWNRNTSYTLINRCIQKEAIAREEPGFVCRARVSREAVRRQQADTLVDAMFEGSRALLFASMLGGRRLTQAEAAHLHALIDAAQEEG